MYYDRKERADKTTVEKQSRMITEKSLADLISEYSEDFAGVLNYNRQFVYVNRNYFDENSDKNSIIGMRPGEVLGCIHADKSEYLCGTSAACNYCEVINTVVEVIKNKRRVTNDSRLLVNNNGALSAMDVRITGMPITVEDEQFILLFFKDISREKRVKILERAFFHDILNSSSALSSLISVSTITSDLVPDVDKTIATNITDIIEHIQYYQKLKYAEEGELFIESSLINPSEEIMEIIKTLENTGYCAGKKIDKKIPHASGIISTDRILFRRIVHNLVKNALEASNPGETVSVSLSGEEDHIICEVRNPLVMTAEVKNQVFRRSFSTKGEGRGIGTYSSRILAERYLNGEVSFTSAKPEGTVFRLKIRGRYT